MGTPTTAAPLAQFGVEALDTGDFADQLGSRERATSSLGRQFGSEHLDQLADLPLRLNGLWGCRHRWR